MPKLHLKRTAAEEAERRHRKATRKRYLASQGDDDQRHRRRQRSKRRRTSPGVRQAKANPSTTDGEDPSPPSNPPVDYEQIRAECEEIRFQDKMWAAYDDDERLDGIEARLNEFAHVPERWRTGSAGKRTRGELDADDDLGAGDPRYMDDEEYAEWVRIGMWRCARQNAIGVYICDFSEKKCLSFV